METYLKIHKKTHECNISTKLFFYSVIPVNLTIKRAYYRSVHYFLSQFAQCAIRFSEFFFFFLICTGTR